MKNYTSRSYIYGKSCAAIKLQNLYCLITFLMFLYIVIENRRKTHDNKAPTLLLLSMEPTISLLSHNTHNKLTKIKIYYKIFMVGLYFLYNMFYRRLVFISKHIVCVLRHKRVLKVMRQQIIIITR